MVTPTPRQNRVKYLQPSFIPNGIDINCSLFLQSLRENSCKASVNVAGNLQRRLLLFTKDKVMKVGIRFSEHGVMDVTFNLGFFIELS